MGGDTKMAARVPVEPCAGKSGHLSGGRRLAGSSTKLSVWGRPIRDPKIAAFGRRCAIARLYRATGGSYAKTPSMAHRQWALTDVVKQWDPDGPPNPMIPYGIYGGLVGYVAASRSLSRGVGAAPGEPSLRAEANMIFLFQHPERREWRENTGTYGLYEWGSSGFAAAYGISLSRESRDRLYPPYAQ